MIHGFTGRAGPPGPPPVPLSLCHSDAARPAVAPDLLPAELGDELGAVAQACDGHGVSVDDFAVD